jgi:hypothetical protein
MTPRLSCVGVPLCAHWLDHPGVCGPAVARLPPAIQAQKRAHPDADVALGQHQEPTRRRRLPALFFAPVLGIAPLPRGAPREPPLATLLGRGYPRPTLRQCRGQRERIAAAAALRPAWWPDQAGPLPSVEGPMSA